MVGESAANGNITSAQAADEAYERGAPGIVNTISK